MNMKLMNPASRLKKSNPNFKKTTYAGLPHKFEAGTPNIAGVIAFGTAIDYMNNIGFDRGVAMFVDLRNQI